MLVMTCCVHTHIEQIQTELDANNVMKFQYVLFVVETQQGEKIWRCKMNGMPSKLYLRVFIYIYIYIPIYRPNCLYIYLIIHQCLLLIVILMIFVLAFWRLAFV